MNIFGVLVVPHSRDGLEVIIVAPVGVDSRLGGSDYVIGLLVSALLLVAVEGGLQLGRLHNVVVAVVLLVIPLCTYLYLVSSLFEDSAKRSGFIGDISSDAERRRSLFNRILMVPHHRAKRSINLSHLLGGNHMD